MNRALYVAAPIGLALLVIGAGWSVLAPRELGLIATALMIAGGALLVLGLWMRRGTLFGGSGKRRMRYGAGAIASVGVIVAIVLLLNFFAARHKQLWDLTRAGTYSLHPASMRVLQQVQKDIEVVAFHPSSDSPFHAVRQLFALFSYHQPRVHVSVVDPNKSPELYTRLGMPGNKVTVVSAGERRIVFPGHEEADLAAALVEVNRAAPRKLYWVSGHGERAMAAQGGLGYQRLAGDLAKEYFELQPLSLAAAEPVPDDAAVVVLADPRRALPPAEVVHYLDYLERGGRMLVLTDIDPVQGSGPHPLEPLLSEWGLRPQPTVVLDPRARTGDLDPRNVIGDRFPHASVSALSGQRVMLRGVRSLELFGVMRDQQIFHNVLVTSGADPSGRGKQPFAESDLAVATVPAESLAGRFAPPETQPPHLGLIAFRKFDPEPGSDSGKEARLALMGDADFLSNDGYDVESNRELALNLFRWLSGEELLIRREGEARPAKVAMSITPNQKSLVLALVSVLPIGVFLAGSIVWFVRRSK